VYGITVKEINIRGISNSRNIEKIKKYIKCKGDLK